MDSQHDDGAPDAPSKSALKRAHRALQSLGDELLRATPGELDRLPLPAPLRDAVDAGRAMRKGARARHVRHLGNLLAREDVERIRDALAALRGAGVADTARLHRAERWRERLLEEGDDALGELAAQFPQLDRPRLRALVRGAREERARDAPPRRFRELLRALRELDEAGP